MLDHCWHQAEDKAAAEESVECPAAEDKGAAAECPADESPPVDSLAEEEPAVHAEEEPAVPAVRMYLTVVCLVPQRLYDQYWSMAVQHWAGSQDEVWHQPLAAGEDQAAVQAVQV